MTVPQKNTLIAVVTCKQYANRARACHSTWVPLARDAGYDVEFFDGERLGVPDDYLSLPLKTKAICGWALKYGYKHMIKCDDDVYIHVKNLKTVTHDYAGTRIPANDAGSSRLNIPAFPKGTVKFHYASGGCYWLSGRSMKILVDAPFDGDWAEDRWVGQVLGRAGIQLSILPWYVIPWDCTANKPVAWRSHLTKDLISLTQLSEPDDILECHKVLVEGRSLGELHPAPRQLAPIHGLPIPCQPSNTTHSFTLPQNAKPAPQVPVPVKKPNPNWQRDIPGAKVKHAIDRGFKVAAVCPFGSEYHKKLRRAFPSHLEEVIDTPKEKKVLFLVK